MRFRCRRRIVHVLFIAGVILGYCLAICAASREQARTTKFVPNHGKPPMPFELNQGQADARVKFLARGLGYRLFLTNTEAVLSLRGASPHGSTAVHLDLQGGNERAQVVGMEELPGKANYFIGNDRTKWRRNVPTYAKVKCVGVYPGVDLVYYANEGQLEYDFVVAPGADPKAIALNLTVSTNGKEPKVEDNGDLVIGVDRGEVRLHKPLVYQTGDLGQQLIAAKFVLKNKKFVEFEVASYDRRKPLVIDPKLTYSSYYGGSGYDSAAGIAVDASGSIYLGGTTGSADDFPTHNNEQGSFNGTNDMFLAKLTPDGSYYVYSTYIGGSGESDDGRDYDTAYGMAVDSDGNAYLGGVSNCGFPTTDNAYQQNANCVDDNQILVHPVVVKLSAAGDELLYSTYVGGNGRSWAHAIAVDRQGNAYVTGHANVGFPITSNAYSSTCTNCSRNDYPSHTFVTKIDTTSSGNASLKYSTYLGDTDADFNSDEGNAIAVDNAGNVYVAGSARTSVFPVTDSAYQATHSGTSVFIAKINPNVAAGQGAESLVYSSFLGDDFMITHSIVRGVAVYDASNVYIVGSTPSSDFPVKNAFQSQCASCTTYSSKEDAFIAKFDTTQSGETSLAWSSFLGGNNSDYGSSIALDSDGNVYVAGQTESTDFPVSSNAPQTSLADIDVTYPNNGDAFVVRIKGDGSKVLYSTYLGGSGGDNAIGIAVNGSKSAYVIGENVLGGFPVTDGAFQGFTRGDQEVFVSRLSLDPDFFLSPVSAMTADLGGSGSSTAIVNSLDDFTDDVTLSLSGNSGFSGSFTPNPATPPANDSASSSLTVNVGPSVTPGSYGLTLTGNSRALTHGTPVSITVNASTGAVTQVISTTTALGCINSEGVANALTVKLAQAQALIDAGDIQSAINTLTALLHQLNAQAGKHVSMTCTDSNGNTFDPVQVLITDVQALLQSLGAASIKANPITGTVANSSGAGVAGATVNLISGKNVIASAGTDATGFFYFAKTRVLILGSTYIISISPPKPYKKATTANFNWAGNEITVNPIIN